VSIRVNPPAADKSVSKKSRVISEICVGTRGFFPDSSTPPYGCARNDRAWLRPRAIIFYTGVTWFRPWLERLCVHVLLPCAGHWRYAFLFVYPVFY
jgi:hypothetical protein